MNSKASVLTAIAAIEKKLVDSRASGSALGDVLLARDAVFSPLQR